MPGDLIIGFTGTRACAQADVNAHMREDSYLFESARGFVTGACHGFDAYAGEWLFRHYPMKSHMIVIPANRSQVDEWWRKPGLQDLRRMSPLAIVLFEMPDGTSYKDRNQCIVNLSSSFYFYAEYPERDPKSLRSGTWQTVRLARKAGTALTGRVNNA